MLILGISTSSNIASVALSKDAECIKELNINNNKTHSETLLPLINELLSETNIKLQDINLIACDNGPGSFTGIRIGISTVKAIAESLNIPVIAVSSLEGLAYNIHDSECICSLIDARNNQVYCGIYDNKINKLEEYMADDIENVLLVLNKYDDIVFVGDGAVLHEDMIREKMVGKKIVFSSNNKQNAESLGIIAYKKIKNGEFTDPDSVVPVYLRKSQAERLKDAKENS